MRPLQCPAGYRKATRKDQDLLTAFLLKQFAEVRGSPSCVRARLPLAQAGSCTSPLSTPCLSWLAHHLQGVCSPISHPTHPASPPRSRPPSAVERALVAPLPLSAHLLVPACACRAGGDAAPPEGQVPLPGRYPGDALLVPQRLHPDLAQGVCVCACVWGKGNALPAGLGQPCGGGEAAGCISACGSAAPLPRAQPITSLAPCRGLPVVAGPFLLETCDSFFSLFTIPYLLPFRRAWPPT